MKALLHIVVKMTLSTNLHEIKQMCSEVSAERLQHVEKFVVFCGHAHSGHSLIGALLDSHPDIAISNEVNVAKLVMDHDLNATEVMSIILSRSQENQAADGWLNTGYSYKTPTGHQGNSFSPKIIGDKKGGGNTRIIRKKPELLNRFDQLFGERLCFVQVIRNPYDNIAAFSHYWQEPLNTRHVDRYFENLETTLMIRDSGVGRFHTMMYSDFMADPSAELGQLFSFLDIQTEQTLLAEITSIVRPSENHRRHQVDWPGEVLAHIEKKLKKIDREHPEHSLYLSNYFTF